MATTLTILNGRLRVDTSGDNYLVLSPKPDSDKPCCCQCGFPAFDGSGKLYKTAWLVDADDCHFTPDDFDGNFTCEANCDEPGYNAIVVDSQGGYVAIYPVGTRTNVPEAWPIPEAPSNTPTYAAVVIDAACNNADGSKIGWVLRDPID